MPYFIKKMKYLKMVLLVDCKFSILIEINSNKVKL